MWTALSCLVPREPETVRFLLWLESSVSVVFPPHMISQLPCDAVFDGVEGFLKVYEAVMYLLCFSLHFFYKQSQD